MSRPPLSRERLRELPDGRLALRLKSPWDDETTHLVFRPLVVPPRPPSSEEGEAPKRRRRSGWIPWQELMKRTFGVSVLLCPRYQTLMMLRALVRTHEVSRKLLVEAA